ncbi:ATP-binding protein [Mesoplasma lactucae]|uniref:IstB-like ATP-binding domain-containing protein n=1 Tax=Mesoplasma lactucae ATCC 49193 TaxID=81460 RepID=A0A291IRI7_9MOLU|nr:ATP-binding protein [Mesoplasma lactucae]ATG97555.1 hypothetical protein CP520_02195 [Mesoplasma lactucae ATCC 49193]ATZ19986.1 primosomal protein DnaI [Mesoplasma lactucae ATCC 49193]MCL8217063.1 hypothetical protein [Mesoplasma lactucae ATCC 49193]
MEIDKLKNQAIVDNLIFENDIPSETVKLYDREIYHFIQNHMDCNEKLEDITSCQQKLKGYKESLEYDNNRFYQKVVPCEHTLYLEEKAKFQSKFLVCDFNPLNFKNGLYKDNEQNLKFFLLNDYDSPKKWKIIEQKVKSCEEYEMKRKIITFYMNMIDNKDQNFGIYLEGNLGIGKTTLFQFLAIDAVKNHNKTVAFISVSNLMNQIKGTFGTTNSEYRDLMNNLQKADILFLDDIGGEPASAWLRDDILFSILNYRMDHHKPTFFTSNFSIDALKKSYLTQIGKNFSGSKQDNFIKNERFFERINTLSKELKLSGDNHRIK